MILAFAHRKRVGKDTAARFVCSHLRIQKKGLDIIQAGFADKLKDICYQLYSWAGLQYGDFYERPENENMREIILPRIGKTPRQIWIEVANHLRTVHPGTWIDYLYHNTQCDLCVIKDLRYPDEANRILGLGGLVFKINRPSIPHTSDIADDALIGYDKWSGEINNHGTLQEFHNNVITTVATRILEQLEGT